MTIYEFLSMLRYFGDAAFYAAVFLVTWFVAECFVGLVFFACGIWKERRESVS